MYRGWVGVAWNWSHSDTDNPTQTAAKRWHRQQLPLLQWVCCCCCCCSFSFPKVWLARRRSVSVSKLAIRREVAHILVGGGARRVRGYGLGQVGAGLVALRALRAMLWPSLARLSLLLPLLWLWQVNVLVLEDGLAAILGVLLLLVMLMQWWVIAIIKKKIQLANILPIISILSNWNYQSMKGITLFAY